MINPNDQGQASPIVVKLYSLQDASAFNEADFFSLYRISQDKPAGTITLLCTLILTPGMVQKITVPAPAFTQYVGAVAAFQSLNGSTWRTLVLAKHHTLDLSIRTKTIQFIKE